MFTEVKIPKSCRNSLYTDNMQLFSLGSSSEIEIAHAVSHQTSIIIAMAHSKKFQTAFLCSRALIFFCCSLNSFSPHSVLTDVNTGELNQIRCFLLVISVKFQCNPEELLNEKKEKHTKREALKTLKYILLFFQFWTSYTCPLLPLPQHKPSHTWLSEIMLSQRNTDEKCKNKLGKQISSSSVYFCCSAMSHKIYF